MRTGPRIDGYRVIREGLTGDETIVVNGLMRVRPGVTVKPEMIDLPPKRRDAGAVAMRFAHFFVDRPIFAAVLSIVLLIVGGIAYTQLPVAQYPEIAPPTIVVRAAYPGADAETIAATVATPLEQEINGVEDMLYMSSYSSGDGAMSLTITFELGTDLDQAQVLVQNRVSIAEPRLPEEVRRLGVTTAKSSPDLMMVVHMLSPDDTYDQLYVSNYARTRVRDVLLRLDGVGDVHHLRRARIFAAHLARSGKAVRLRHDRRRRRASRCATRTSRSRAARSARRRSTTASAFQYTVTTQGRFEDARDFRYVIVKSTEDGRLITLQDVARIELGAKDYVTNSYLNGKPAVALGIFQRPGTNALAAAEEIQATMKRPLGGFPEGARLRHRLQPDRVHRRVDQRGLQDDRRGDPARRHRHHRLPAILAHGDRADRGHPGLADRHVGGALRVRLLAQHADAVRPGAGDRHRRRRRDRRGRECRAQHRARA